MYALLPHNHHYDYQLPKTKQNKQTSKMTKKQQQPTKLDPFIVTVLQQCYAIINFCQHQISQLYHYSISVVDCHIYLLSIRGRVGKCVVSMPTSTRKCMNIGEYIVEDRIRHIHWQPLDMWLGSTWTGT